MYLVANTQNKLMEVTTLMSITMALKQETKYSLDINDQKVLRYQECIRGFEIIISNKTAERGELEEVYDKFVAFVENKFHQMVDGEVFELVSFAKCPDDEINTYYDTVVVDVDYIDEFKLCWKQFKEDLKTVESKQIDKDTEKDIKSHDALCEEMGISPTLCSDIREYQCLSCNSIFDQDDLECNEGSCCHCGSRSNTEYDEHLGENGNYYYENGEEEISSEEKKANGDEIEEPEFYKMGEDPQDRQFYESDDDLPF